MGKTGGKEPRSHANDEAPPAGLPTNGHTWERQRDENARRIREELRDERATTVGRSPSDPGSERS